ncbi:hypothetical protein HNP84_007947 [Thermocatellispora tengchongensis]|uniref:PE domain-containing protein n=1 Tax=Thermocatellispora tengchongensis TaxID=1073253 RepID=A0A840P9Y2_9ACTN|nr:hypothetical protein [Thermocatellispora tengchongensis]MBB5138194.1 hypothetical protein [Thermocatellispora tengchongensis]
MSGDSYEGLRLDPNWPGIEEGARNHVDRAALRNLARSLQEELDRLTGPASAHGQQASGTLDDLEFWGNIDPRHIGTWDVAQKYGETVKKAHTEIFQIYGDLVAQYQAVISTIQRAAGNWDDAEQASGGRETAAQA